MTEAINLVTDTGLDYASAIPLSLLNVGTAKPVLPISLGQTPLEKDFAFGKLLQKYILESDKKIAVIASADLSHRVTKKSPIGYSPKGKKFDQKILEALKDLDSASLLTMQTAAEDAACEDLPVLATLLGILDDVGCNPEMLSYEAPFGVGHAAIHYRFGSQSPL
jgi:AmmeMemoRadiSam system protein B